MKNECRCWSVFYMLVFFIGHINAQNITKSNIKGPMGLEVNSYSGNLFYQRQDLSIPGRGLSLDITFYYNSARTAKNWGFGKGWTFTYNMAYALENQDIVVERMDGRKDKFTKSGNVYLSPPGVFDSLEQYEPGKFRMTAKNGMKYFFAQSAHKKLTKIEDRYGNALNLNYTDSLLTGIADASGRTLQLSWANGRLASITDLNTSPARIIQYQYDNRGNLSRITDPLGNTLEYTYNDFHLLASIVDESGYPVNILYNNALAVKEIISCLSHQKITYSATQRKTFHTEQVGSEQQVTIYEYDAQGRLTRQHGNCCGFDRKYGYDSDNNVVQITDANGNTTYYTYDKQGNLLKEIDPLGKFTTNYYSTDFNLLTKSVDKRGNSLNYTYDNSGRLIQIQKPLGITNSFTYDAYGNIQSFTDGRNNTVSYRYSGFGYRSFILLPTGDSLVYAYDNVGNLTSVTNTRGYATHFEYDLKNRHTKMTDALGNITRYAYDNKGNVTQVTDPSGAVQKFEYDALDRQTKAILPHGIVLEYGYDSKGNRVQTKDPQGNISQRKYNDMNLLTEETDQAGNTIYFGYDANGNMTSVTDPLGNSTIMAYDALNRLVTLTDALGHTNKFSYDQNGNKIGLTDANSYQTIWQYDALNRIKKVIDPLGREMEYTYDPNDNVLTVKDPKGQLTQYAYDALNRKMAITYADNTVKTIQHDAEGNLVQRVDNNGVSTQYTYDALNRLTARNYPGTDLDDVFTYDAASRLLSVQNSVASVVFVYDSLGRPVSETLNGKTTQYGYDAAMGTRTVIYPGGRAIVEQFDNRGLLSQIKEGNTVLASIAYDVAQRPVTRSFENGISVGYVYDKSSRIVEVNGSPNNFMRYKYNYDNSQHPKAVEKLHYPALSEQYQYDNTYQLISSRKGQLSGDQIPNPLDVRTYNYDPAGNRNYQTINGMTTTYNVNSMNAYTNVVTGNQTLNWTYDNNGNPLSDGVNTYAYDLENRLTSINNGQVIFTYDPFGRPIEKKASGVPTKYYYARQRIVEERNAQDAVDVSYVYGSWIDDLLSAKRGGNTYFFHRNTIGSIVAATDASGVVIERYEYDDFGNPHFYNANFGDLPASAIQNNMLFSGRYFHPEIALFNYRARYYQPEAGRFLNRDPLERVDDLNLYAYVENNPVVYIDPMGLFKNPVNSDKIRDRISDVGNPHGASFHACSCPCHITGCCDNKKYCREKWGNDEEGRRNCCKNNCKDNLLCYITCIGGGVANDDPIFNPCDLGDCGGDNEDPCDYCGVNPICECICEGELLNLFECIKKKSDGEDKGDGVDPYTVIEYIPPIKPIVGNPIIQFQPPIRDVDIERMLDISNGGLILTPGLINLLGN